MKALPSPALQARYVGSGEMKPQRRIWRGLLSLAVLSYAAWGWIAVLFSLPSPFGF